MANGFTRRGRWRCAAVGAVLTVAFVLAPLSAHSEIRPLVREMLENLASLNEIGTGVAIGDFERVKRAAADLDARAGILLDFDVTRLGVAARKGPTFNVYLREQQQAARMIAKAAKGKDGALVFKGVRGLLDRACIACHKIFRERENLMRPQVILMTSFLDAWQDMNRGMLTENFDLVSRRAHDLQVVGKVFAAESVISNAFDIDDPGDIGEFREFLLTVIARAKEVERAADAEQIGGIIEGTQRMWTGGCLACHDQFRDED